MEDLLGRPESTLCHMSRGVDVFLYNRYGDALQGLPARLLRDEEGGVARIKKYQASIAGQGMPYADVFAFLDGKFLRCARPAGANDRQRAVYSGHKKAHGVKFSGLLSPDGRWEEGRVGKGWWWTGWGGGDAL